MRNGRRLALVTLLLLAGSACQSIDDLELPAIGSVASRILAYAGPNQGANTGVGLYAFDPNTPSGAFNSPDSRAIYVLDYADSLEALSLVPGPFPEQNGLGRELPLPTAAYRKNEGEAWDSLTPSEAIMLLGQPRVPGLSPDACRDDSEPSCYHYTDQLYCERPCEPQPLPTLPTPPAPPALPRFLPCPDDWSPVQTMLEDRPLTWCTPPPMVDCGLGQAQFLGSAGCSPVGSTCPPPGAFASGLPTGHNIIYVREGAVGGTGSESLPLGTLADAVLLAGSQDVIALAGGRYAGGVTLPADVALIGACVEDTIVESSDAAALTFTAAGAARNLRIEGERGVAITGSGGMRVEIASLQVSTRRAPIAISGSATLAGDHLSILGTPLLIELESAEQIGIYAHDGAHIDVRDVSIVDGVFKGIEVYAASAFISRLSLQRMRAQVSGFLMWGVGIHANEGARVRARYIASEDNGGATLAAWGLSMLDADQVVIRRTIARLPPIEMHQNLGLDAFSGSDLIVRHVVVRDSEESGLWIFNDNSVTIEDALFEDLGRYAIKAPNAGGVSQTFRRVAIHNMGIGGALLSARCDVSDLTIVGVGARAVEDDSSGIGLSVRYGDTRIDRALISGVASVGVEACGADTSDRLTLNDVTVRGVDDNVDLKSSCLESAGLGVGIQVFGRGGSKLSRTVVDDVRGVGVVGLRLTGLDLDVSNSGSEGVRLLDTANLDRARIRAAHFSGLTAIGARAEVRALTVIDTLAGSNDGVPAPVDPLQAAGVALRSRAYVDLTNTTPRMLEGALMVDDFYLSGAAAMAVELDATSTLRLDRGSIVDSTSGIRTNNPNPGTLTIAPTVSIRVRGEPFIQNQ